MYWAIGQRIVEKEQQGKERAEYGEHIIDSQIELSEIRQMPLAESLP